MKKKKNNTTTPHDAPFRQFLAQPEITREFMAIHLPAELLAMHIANCAYEVRKNVLTQIIGPVILLTLSALIIFSMR